MNSAIDAIIREQNITVILAAHRLSSIARAERVIVLENGKVSEEGRYDVLVSGRRSETWAWGVWALLDHLLLDDSRSPRVDWGMGRRVRGLSLDSLCDGDTSFVSTLALARALTSCSSLGDCLHLCRTELGAGAINDWYGSGRIGLWAQG